MKDKEMIEELAKEIEKAKQHIWASVMTQAQDEDYLWHSRAIAKTLYVAGYRKLPDGARVFMPDGKMVLLTMEEAERFRGQTINLKKVKSQASNETAESFYKKVRKLLKKVDLIVDGEEGLVGYEESAVDKGLTEIAKQFGVEIKE